MLQGDEEILETLLCYLHKAFPGLDFDQKIKLNQLFPEPESDYLRRFWKLAHADITVYRHGKLCCVLEIGGKAHFSDKIQKLRDSKKDKLCKLNSINCLRVSNSFLNDLAKPMSKRLLRRYFYG